MCFMLLYQTDRVENPDVVSDPFTGPRDIVDTAVSIWIDNQVVKAVLEEAAKHERVIETTYGVPIGELPERTVIVTNPLGQRYLEIEETVHPELMYVSHHVDLNGKIISLTLKDFGFLGMFSAEHTDKGVVVHIKFGVEAETAATYKCQPPESAPGYSQH